MSWLDTVTILKCFIIIHDNFILDLKKSKCYAQISRDKLLLVSNMLLFAGIKVDRHDQKVSKRFNQAAQMHKV